MLNLFFNDKIFNILFKIIIKMFNPFVLNIMHHIMIVSNTALLYWALIRPVLCIGAIVKPN